MRDTVMPDPGGGELRIGKKTVANSEARRRLFPFDVYHWYRTAALYADPENKELVVLHTSDHGADVGGSDPIPLRLYMESLLAGGSLADAGARWAADPPGTMRAVRPRGKVKVGVPKSAVQPFQAIRVSA
jgi:hypothetical protein